jgi:hypothetical protein
MVTHSKVSQEVCKDGQNLQGTFNEANNGKITKFWTLLSSYFSISIDVGVQVPVVLSTQATNGSIAPLISLGSFEQPCPNC